MNLHRYLLRYLISFSVLILFFFLITPAQKSYAVACDSPFVWGSTNMGDYCNKNFSFTDIGSLPPSSQTAIKELGKVGIFYGYSDCGAASPCFRPSNKITRWEATAAIVRYHIFVSRDWFAWDPANAPPSQVTNPPSTTYTNDGKKSVFADTYPTDEGFIEAHTAILYGFIRGGNCSEYYPRQYENVGNGNGNYSKRPDGTYYLNPGGDYEIKGYFDSRHNKLLNGSDLCFGAYSDWIYGFHGVYRSGSRYLTFDSTSQNNLLSPPYSNPNSTSGEECWNGCYSFSTTNSNNTLTRADYALQMRNYYGEQDDNNWCISPQTGTLTGSNLRPDPSEPSKLICVIHADENSCSTLINYTTSHTMDNDCNYVHLERSQQSYSRSALGTSGTIQGDTSTGPTDILSYNLGYLFQINSAYLSSGQFNTSLTTLQFYGKPTSGTLSFPDGTCTISANECTQTIAWSTSLISDPNTVTVKDTTDLTNPISITTTGLSGVISYSISDTTTFTLFERGVAIATASVTPERIYSISGIVYVDTNENGIQDAGEQPFEQGAITIAGTTNTTDTTGFYSFLHLKAGIYLVTLTIPNGYTISTANDISVPLTNSTIVNFGIYQNHTAKGKVFNDINKNKLLDTGEIGYPNTVLLTINGNTISQNVPTNTEGEFLFTDLPSGSYTVSLSSGIPQGFSMIWPRNAVPPYYSLTVGNKPCSPGSAASIGASCDTTYNISGINFAISNAIPWIQVIGLDARFDNGFNNPVPSSASTTCSDGYTMIPGSTTTPGVISIGGSTPSLSFGTRLAPSTTGWVIGSPFSEYFSPLSSSPNADNTFQASGIRTAYDYVMANARQSNISPISDNIKQITGCTNYESCSLSNAQNGIFQANGDVMLIKTQFSSGNNFVFLINGNLTINGTITTPIGSTATFIVKGNILVTPSVGTTSTTCPPTDSQIQGFFSTDKSFIIESKDPTQQGLNCSDGSDSDLILNIDGAIVTNASLLGGGFTNKRDLCGTNVTNPSVTIKERLDFVLNAPEILKQKNYIYREIAP